MYFEKNQVTDVLLCQICECRLDIPKILPCGENICSLCEKNIQVNDQMFDCLVCKEKHKMPENGLIINKPLLKILTAKLTRVSRGKAFDSLLKTLDDMQNKHCIIKIGIENSDDLINEYCVDLRSNVQLTVEEVILQVNDIGTKIIEEIDEYEKELIELKKNKVESLDAFNAIAKELESFHSVNTEYLKQHIVDDDIVLKTNEEAINLIKKAELEIENLKEIIFDGTFFKFKKNNQKIAKSLIGETSIGGKIIDSNILTVRNQIKNLMALCEFSIDQKWNLIYRASQDGFQYVNFHSKCDNKPNTFIIIKSASGNIFGGYTEQTWNHPASWKADPNSFIFSLMNKFNRPLKIKCTGNDAIFSSSDYGIIFGDGHTIYISENSNENTKSCSSFGSSYIHPDYASGSNEAKSFLAGSSNFQVIEIEVYTKQ